MILSCGRKIWKPLLWAAIVFLLSWMAHPSRGQGPSGDLAIFSRICKPNECGPQGCPVPKWQPPRLGQIVERPVVPVRRPHPSVVRVINQVSHRKYAGTGTYITPVDSRFGFVLSCEHLFSAGVGEVVVIFPDGKRYQAEVKAVDSLWDLAVMTINGASRIAVKMATRKPQKGEVITFCGYGQGKYRGNGGKLLFYSSPAGLNRFEELNVGAACRQGDSGGPLLNAKGDLVGVITIGGVEEKLTGGPNCVIINRWLAKVLGGKPVEPPPTPNPEPQPTPSKLAVLEKQIAVLQAAVAMLQQLEPIPAGNDGKRGKQGKRGLQGLPGKIDYDKLVKKVLAKLPPITVLIQKDGQLVEDGEKKVFLGGTLPLDFLLVK